MPKVVSWLHSKVNFLRAIGSQSLVHKCLGFIFFFYFQFKNFSQFNLVRALDTCAVWATPGNWDMYALYWRLWGVPPYLIDVWFFFQGLLLYEKTTRNSYLESVDGPAQPSSNMDRFERCFSIFKLDMREEEKATEAPGESGGEASDAPEPNPASGSRAVSHSQQNQGSKPWKAVRVDLVVSPISQFAFALLGWTGSKVSLKWYWEHQISLPD